MLFSELFGLPPFRAVELTAQIQRLLFIPGMLGAYGEALFPTSRISTLHASFAKEDDKLALIPTTERGSPLVELERRPQALKAFTVKRLAKGSTVTADSMTGVLHLSEGMAVKEVMKEFAERGALIRRDVEFTLEWMRFGAIMGRVLDADGTVLDDFWQSWGVSMAPWIELDLANPVMSLSSLRSSIRSIIRHARRMSKGGWIQNRTRYHALCGEAFFNKLVTHPAIETLYLNYQRAIELGNEIEDAFPFGGIIWHDYQGDDDGVLAIADDEAHLFPVSGNEVFRQVYGPAEFEPWINLPGQDLYALTIPDRDRNAWIRWEGYTYPLFVCTRPEMLRRLRIGSAGGPEEGGEGDDEGGEGNGE